MKIQLDPADLRPLIEEVVEEVIARLRDRPDAGGGPQQRLAYTEDEAARLLGMQRYQLRDERLKGRISGSLTSGRKVRYLRSDLDTYLAARRVCGSTTDVPAAG